MDPLSITVSITALLSMATSIATTGYRLGKTFAGAEEEVLRLIAEVTGLLGVLHSLQFMTSQFNDQDISGATQSYPIQSCFTTLAKIKDILAKCDTTSAPNGPKSLGAIKRRLRWPLNVRETKELIDEVGRHKTTLSLAVNVDGMTALLNSLNKQDQLAGQVNEMQASINAAKKSKTLAALTKKHRSILESFSNIDPQMAHDIAIKLRHPGTGVWFTEGFEFKRWLEGDCTRLWLYGIPGAGKTILMSAIIAEAMKVENETNGLAYFYCNYRDPETLVPTNILKSLIRQLAIQNKNAFLEIESFWEQHTTEKYRVAFDTDEEDHEVKSNPTRMLPSDCSRTDAFQSEGLIVDLLQRISHHFDQVMVIVDGLDECGEQTFASTSLLSTLADPQLGTIKTLLASRDEHEIRLQLSDHEKLPISARSSDIRLYVESEIGIRIQQGRLRIRPNALKGGELKDFITQKLIEKADGMFQWVKCQLDHLCQLPNDSARRKALDSLPPTLSLTYERILARVNKQDETVRKLVQRVLRWVVCARESLSPAAIAEIVSIEPDDNRILEDAIPSEEDIMHWCSSLIRKDPQGNFELSHYSVREFLISIPGDTSASPFTPYRADERQDNVASAIDCLRYLCMEDFATGCIYDADIYLNRRKRYPFFGYASAQWDHHAVYDLRDPGLHEIICLLFKAHTGLQYLAWAQHRLLLEWWKLVSDDGIDSSSIDSGTQSGHLNNIAIALIDVSKVHIAAFLALPGVISWLLQQGSNVNIESRLFGNPLSCGCAIMGVVGLSILGTEKKIPDHPKLESWRPELRLATLEVLVGAGADPSSKMLSEFTPLELVTRLAPQVSDITLEMMRILCEAGAICTREIVETGLHRSVAKDATASLFSKAKFLPEDRLEILEIIASWADHETMRRLFDDTSNDRETFQNLSDETYGSMVREAARWNQIEVLQQYYDENRSLEFVDDKLQRTALHNAAAFGQLDAVKFLVQHGANPIAADGDGNTPLHLACLGDNGEIIHYLWEYSDITNFSGESPLMLAAACSSASTLSSLLVKSSQEAIYKKAANGDSLVHFAAASGKASNVAQLLDKGLDIDYARGDLCTPIMTVTGLYKYFYRSSPETSLKLTLEILISRGADLNGQDRQGNGILHFMLDDRVDRMDKETAEYLALLIGQTKIDLNRRNRLGQTPIILMARREYETAPEFHEGSESGAQGVDFPQILRQFLERGAFPNLQDNEGQTCLHFISKFGGILGEQAVQVLLDHGADCELTNADLNNPLDEAIQLDHKVDNAGVIDLLLSKHPDLNQQNNEGETILHRIFGVARCPSFVRIAKAVIERGCDLSVKDFQGNTVLMSAYKQDPAVLEILLSSVLDNDMGQHVYEGCSLLHLALKHCIHENVVSLLLDRTRDFNTRDNDDDGWTTLHWAADTIPSPKIMRRILSLYDNNLSVKDNYGRDPLSIAARGGNDWMVAELIAAKVDLEQRGSWWDSSEGALSHLTPLLATVSDIETPLRQKCAELLIGAGADIEARDGDGWGVLAYSIRHDGESMLRFLSTTNINFASTFPVWLFEERYHLTALLRAAKKGFLECVKVLINSCGSLDRNVVPNQPFTPLFIAACHGHVEVCKFLCGKGEDVNAITPRDGNSPLHGAAMNGHGQVARFLLEFGADVTLRNKAGFTAEAEALARGFEDIVILIQSRASDTNQQSESALPDLRREATPLIGDESAEDSRYASASLSRSIEINSVKFWEQLLSRKFDINTPACMDGSKDGSVCYPLNKTLQLRYEDLTRLFIKHGADVHHRACTNAKSASPLAQSIYWGDIDIMRLILSQYKTPLDKASLASLAEGVCEAALAGSLSCLEGLCDFDDQETNEKKGYKFVYQQAYFRRTALIEAVNAEINQEQSIRLLLRKGADVNDFDEHGYTALHCAAMNGDCSLIRILAENAAHIHARTDVSETPLLLAGQKGHFDAMKLLYELGARLEDLDVYGHGLLHSVRAGEPLKAMPIIAWLTAKLPWKSKITPLLEESLLHRSIDTCRDDCSAVIYLVDNGADLLQLSRRMGSILHVSAGRGNVWLTERLVKLIPSEKVISVLDYPSEFYGTALFKASARGNTKIVEIFLNAGASIDAWSSTFSGPEMCGTALMIACINGHEDVVRFLLSRGARMTVVNSDGVEGSALKVARQRCRRTLRILQMWEAATTDRCSYFLN